MYICLLTELTLCFPTDCGEELRTQPGRYTFLSEGGAQFCTLYLMAPVDNVIEMEFLFFNVDCAENSVVAVSLALTYIYIFTR